MHSRTGPRQGRGWISAPAAAGMVGRRGVLGLVAAGAVGGCAVQPFATLARSEGPGAAVPPASLVHFHGGIPGIAQVTGMGFALDAETVVTNGHVVRGMGAGNPGDRLSGALQGGGRMEFVTLASSAAPDLAVLHATGPLDPLPRAARRPLSGERLWLIGAPLLGRPVVEGEVTAARIRGARGDMFGIRAPATFGFSGGPAVNARGEAVGMVTAFRGMTPQAVLSVALIGFDLPALLDADGREMLVQHADAVEGAARALLATASARAARRAAMPLALARPPAAS